MKRTKRVRRGRKGSDKNPYEKDVNLTDPRSDGRIGREHAGRLRVLVLSWDRSRIHLDAWVGRVDAGVRLTKREATDLVRALREGIRKLKQER